MTARAQLVYRHLPELMLRSGAKPCFERAMRFVYDRAEHGAPTLPKLAREAAVLMEPASGGTQWRGGCRMWIWKDDGEFVGSIVVQLVVETRVVALDDTIQRVVAA